ncbi:hypothetical protein XELAEV_18007700mg [Xenopus laevis]|uniref:Uncharacterized protein n=1 Tax=Xenopus laevis TaxID=8355 RepID=A0A974E2E5_XENLA|nr:hypothetical protein XELAEV_18007700mg [Xenopus laevis]
MQQERDILWGLGSAVSIYQRKYIVLTTWLSAYCCVCGFTYIGTGKSAPLLLIYVICWSPTDNTRKP